MDRKSITDSSTKIKRSPRFTDFLTPEDESDNIPTYTSTPSFTYPSQIPEIELDDPIQHRKSPRFADTLTPTGGPPPIDIPNVPFNAMSVKPITFEKSVSSNSEKTLERLYTEYINNVAKVKNNEALEFEFKFGTIAGSKPITKIQHKNIMDYLYSKGFVVSDSDYMLRIKCKNNNNNIRTEVKGLSNVRIYCQTDDINNVLSSTTFITKNPYGNNSTNVGGNTFDKVDYNYRASLSIEKTINSEELPGELLKNWNTSLKEFRYINRIRMAHPMFAVFIDCSIVKTSKKKGNTYKPFANIHESGVFDAVETYEIEIECDNLKIGNVAEYSTGTKLKDDMKKLIKYIMSGIQSTQYPVGLNEQESILKNYMDLLTSDKYKPRFPITPSMFAGPSSYTLELKNILSGDENSVVPNIRNNYCVTDKADGERKLLYINTNGHIYLLNMNMDVQFTGAISGNREVWNTLIDGEHILRNADKKYVNIYAAFDIYYINRADKRNLIFIDAGTNVANVANSEKSRFVLMTSAINKIDAHSVVSKSKASPIKITHKTFYLPDHTNAESTIFGSCKSVWEKYTGGLMGYEIDGLIFTPINTGVGSDKPGVYTTPEQRAWSNSFKWKPSEMNTIDFMVTFKKNADGSDIINNLFDTGMAMYDLNPVTRYKTLVLRTGYSERKHGFSNPSNMVISDNIIPSGEFSENSQEYKPVQFFPSNPYDDSAGICNLKMHEDGNLYTEHGEIIENNSIVEFSYDYNSEKTRKWNPKRVRYDKTAQLRSGVKQYGNAYHVANNIWHTIHNPVTVDMITTGQNIQSDEDNDDDVYYNKKTSINKTQAMRDFHNDIKRALISAVSSPDNTLIDMAVGKAGDLHKWKSDKLKFVFGIDINRDNIHNQRDGAYARYIETYRKNYRMPGALFVVGNSAMNIKSGEGILVDGDKQITNAVFGKGVNNAAILGKNVSKNYGIAKDGFDICSIQFAVHYMFQSTDALDAFLKNVASVTKKGGFFIGTCYDGGAIFEMLKTKKNGESVLIMSNDNFNQSKKICEITKRYDDDVFYDDERSLGMAIDVYQESINKTFREYLVNFKYMSRLLRETYGFHPIESDELISRHSELDNSSGMFKEVFTKIKNKCNVSCNNVSKNILNMSPEEQTVSFLNRYFIFKKTENINVSNLKTTLNLNAAHMSNINIIPSENVEKVERVEKVNKSVSFGEYPMQAAPIVANVLTGKQKIKIPSKKTKTGIFAEDVNAGESVIPANLNEIATTTATTTAIGLDNPIPPKIKIKLPSKKNTNTVASIIKPEIEPVIVPAEPKVRKLTSKKTVPLGNTLKIP